MTNVGRMALRRRPTRRVLKLISPQPLLHHSSSQQRLSSGLSGSAVRLHLCSCQRMRVFRRQLGIPDVLG